MAKEGTGSQNEVIKGRTLNLTLFSGLAAAIATAITVLNESFESIFGTDLTTTQFVETKLTLVVAIIAAFALIVVADILARAWANSTDKTVVTPMPGAPRAKTVDGEGHVTAIRVRTVTPDEVEYLFVRTGATPTWEAAAKVRILQQT